MCCEGEHCQINDLSYFAIITFFFFHFSFFICSIQDGTVGGVDTKTGVEYNLNGPTA